MEKGKKTGPCRDLNPGPCAWQVGMLNITLEQIIHLILSITISEQIFESLISETFTFNEENLIQQKSSKCSKEYIQTPGKR